ncbi:hypothetical protein HYH03_010597 [Edaphochlamys debaryana]|uniref:CASTOR/POLLUX/SYM8 ion channel conserved domain-containing protein n=1 Tax=Edaphochlamys debaryana TaxID=47281 RepID=A0A836BVY4_9CHLO|nr:hypothetical protein HYH03_010597 [Edaphochlamys debaryana]|eukprot:KAG2491156.1 hypothetical protein HYH03_010597 [Edaphochlamys debaryana]
MLSRAVPLLVGATLAAATFLAVAARRGDPQHTAWQSAQPLTATTVSASSQQSLMRLSAGPGRPVLLASMSMSSQPCPTEPTHPFADVLGYMHYKLLQALQLPTWGKVLTVLAVAVPVLAAGSAALCAVTGEPAKAALLRCYYILNNVPGADVAGEENPRAAVLLNFIYVTGLLTFAVLIGVLGDDIGSAVESARLGNTRVPERNHTVVIGHNRQLVEVLRQVAVVRTDRGAAAFPGQLVVLSPVGREELDAQLLEALGPAAAAGVVTRQGSPLKMSDLHRVSAGHARTVILLAPEEEGGGGGGEEAEGGSEEGEGGFALTAEAQQAVTLAALHHLRQAALTGPGGARLGPATQTVVVQQDTALDLVTAATASASASTAGAGGAGGAACAASSRLVASVSHLNNLARIQAQCAAQPGLSLVLSCVMQQQPGLPEFYVQAVPEVVGLTYGEARHLFPAAVLCGVYEPPAHAGPSAPAAPAPTAEERLDAEAEAVRLNPPDSLVVEPQHALILLADRAQDLRPSKTRHQILDMIRARDQAAAIAAPAVDQATEQPGKRRRGGLMIGLLGLGGGGGGRDAATAAEVEAARPMRVVVLAFDGRRPTDLIEGLQDYCPEGSQVTVVAPEGSEAAEPEKRSRAQQQALRVGCVAADPRTRAALAEAAATDADAVILTGLDSASSDEADAQALATLLQLQAAMPSALAEDTSDALEPVTEGGPGAGVPALPQSQRRRRPLSLVCGVTDPRTRDIMRALVRVPGAGGGGAACARRGIVLDTVNADELLAGVLTQVAAEPRLSGLFHELSSAEGVEVYLRTPGQLGLPYGQPLSWEQAQDAGRAQATTVIGVVRSGGGPQARLAPCVQLGAPEAKASLTLAPGDKLVILAEGDR